MPADRPDDTPPRVARRVARPVADDTDEHEPTRPSRYPPAWPMIAAGGLAGLLVVGSVVVVTVALNGRRAVERQRVAAEAARVEAERAAVAPPQIAAPAANTLPATESITVRELDKEAGQELGAAFHANPVAAKQKYANVRWRLRDSYVRDFSGDSSAVMGGGHTQAVVEFRGSELVKLKRNTPHIIEARCDDYSNTAAGPSVNFSDAVVIK